MEKFNFKVWLIRGGTHRIKGADSIVVGNGLIVVNKGVTTRVFPLHNIKQYKFTNSQVV